MDRPLQEARHKGKPLVGPYSARFERAHASYVQDHLHVFHRNNEIFAINKDGTAHDQSHQTHIPNKVASAIQKQYRQINLPDDGLIESVE